MYSPQSGAGALYKYTQLVGPEEMTTPMCRRCYIYWSTPCLITIQRSYQLKVRRWLLLIGLVHRGVRMVASAHGDLQSLLKNPNLNTLLGGTVSETIGDKAAEDNGGNKVGYSV